MSDFYCVITMAKSIHDNIIIIIDINGKSDD